MADVSMLVTAPEAAEVAESCYAIPSDPLMVAPRLFEMKHALMVDVGYIVLDHRTSLIVVMRYW